AGQRVRAGGQRVRAGGGRLETDAGRWRGRLWPTRRRKGWGGRRKALGRGGLHRGHRRGRVGTGGRSGRRRDARPRTDRRRGGGRLRLRDGGTEDRGDQPSSARAKLHGRELNLDGLESKGLYVAKLLPNVRSRRRSTARAQGSEPSRRADPGGSAVSQSLRRRSISSGESGNVFSSRRRASSTRPARASACAYEAAISGSYGTAWC